MPRFISGPLLARSSVLTLRTHFEALAQEVPLATQVGLTTASPTANRGDRVLVQAVGCSISYPPRIEVHVPDGLIAEGPVTCESQAIVVDNPRAAVVYENPGCSASLTTASVAGYAGAGAVSGLSSSYNSTYHLSLSFFVRVLKTAPLGATLNISAPFGGLRASSASVSLRIAGSATVPTPKGSAIALTRPMVKSAQQPASQQAPRASATLIPGGADADAPLVFIPTSIVAHPGDHITLDVDFVRLQGIISVSMG